MYAGADGAEHGEHEKLPLMLEEYVDWFREECERFGGSDCHEKYDTFKVDNSRQQLIVKATPQRKADVFWEYTCQLIDADYTSILDAASCQAGMTTRFLSNIMPEYHEEGKKRVAFCD